MATKRLSVASNRKKTTTPAKKIVKKASVPKPKPLTRADWHPLAALIPNREYYVNKYEGREVSGLADVDILKHAMSLRHNVLIEGPTGAAKTTMVYTFAAMHDLPLVNIPCNSGLEADSLIGGPLPNADGSINPFVPGDMTLGCLYGAVLYFDELNMMSPRVSAAFHGMADARRVLTVKEAAGSGWCASCGLYNDAQEKAEQQKEVLLAKNRGESVKPVLCDFCKKRFQSTVVKLHDDCFIVGTYNPGYEGTYPLNEAWKNRFGIVMVIDYDREVEERCLYSKSLIEMANDIRSRYLRGDVRSPVGTNKLMEFEEFALDENLGFSFAMENLLSYFHSEERSAIKKVMEEYSNRIYRELNEDDEDSDDTEPANTDDAAFVVVNND